MHSKIGSVLVIGGMGYVGCILSDMLKANEIEVDIVDCCFFENEHTPIIYDNLYNVNIINYKLDKKYDLIIWCSDLDIDEFYRYDEFGDYIKSYINKFGEVCKDNRVLYITSFKSLLSDVNSIKFASYKRFLDCMKNEIQDSTMTFYLGSLYGPSPRMRWDTHINSIFYNFIVNECCVLSDDWLQEFPCCNVMSAASYIKDFIESNVKYILGDYEFDDKFVFSETVNLLEVAHRVRLCVEDGKEHYPIFTSEYDYTKYILEYDECVTNGVTIESSIEHFLKEMESQHLPDFENDKYNNNKMLNVLRKSFNMFEKMDWLKNVKHKNE